MYKMILVDDDYITREGLRDLIDWSDLGVEIAGEAEDGEEALLKVKVIQPDIIISDVVMPGMNGIKLAEILKEKMPEAKVIMISAHQDIQYIKASIKLETIDYILKPFNRDELRQVVKKVIDRIESERAEKKLKDDVARYFTGSISSTGIPVIVDMQDKIINLCGSGQLDELEAEIKKFFSAIRQLKMDSMLYLTTVCSELIVKALKKVSANEENAVVAKVRESMQEFRKMQTSHDMENFVMDNLLYLENMMKESKTGKSRRVVRDVENIIERNYNQNITIQQLADEVFMSTGHLQILFKKETGNTINDYITMVRIEKARELLKDPAVKVYEVANSVGYQDTNYFTRIFKKIVGELPMEYREKML